MLQGWREVHGKMKEQGLYVIAIQQVKQIKNFQTKA